MEFMIPEPSREVSVFMAASNSPPPTRTVAVEVLVPLGARAEYGLLGGEFSPMASTTLLRVDVFYGVGDHVASLASGFDEVRAGLPREFARAVGAEIESLRGRVEVSPGVLTLSYAAHGLVGSSERMFRRLARWLVMSATTGDGVPDEELLSLFQP